MFDTRAVQQQPISLALVVEPKAQQLVLHGLCRRTWRVHAACGAREARGGGQKARWHALQRSGCSGLSARVGVSVGLVSSALWDRLTATRRTVVLVVLRLGASGTSTGGGMTVVDLEVARWWPVVIVSFGERIPGLKWMIVSATNDVCV